MNASIEIGSFSIMKRKEKNRNIFTVSIIRKNVHKKRTIQTCNSFTEWTEREATIRYDKLISYARKNS